MSHHLLILTGDHSADQHAAGVIEALRRIDPSWQISGVGGSAMAETGVEIIADHRDMNVIGIGGVVRAVPSHLRLGRKILDWVDAHRPTVAVLIDYGVFHLWLAPKLRARGVRVLYFIPPQIWASRPWRLRKLKRAADEVLCILPFEEQYYRSHGIPATFVGNPLTSRLPAPIDKRTFAPQHGLDPERQLIGLFPGSRKLEISHLLEAQIEAAHILNDRHPDRFAFALSRARNLKDEFFNAAFERAGGTRYPWLTVVRDNHGLLSCADVALLASGTVTLEAALYKTPMIVMYRGPAYAYVAAKALITVPHISLPNNLVGRRLVPELLQYDVTPQRLVAETERLLDPATNGAMRQELASVAALFADIDTPMRVAEAIERLAQDEVLSPSSHEGRGQG